MSEKPIVKRAVLKLHQIYCPRCSALEVVIPEHQAILNASPEGILVTFHCPRCVDIVQVYAAGETYAELKAEGGSHE